MAISDNNTRKKQYLREYFNGIHKERYIEQLIAELRSRTMMPGLKTDDMPHGNYPNDLSSYMAELDRLINWLETEKQNTIRKYQEIYTNINQMKDGDEKELLVRRYLLGQKWELIAEQMNYSVRTITRLHGRALQKLRLP